MTILRALLGLALVVLAGSCVDEDDPDTDLTESALMTGPAGTYQTTLVRSRDAWFVHPWGGLPSNWYQSACCATLARPAPFGYGESYVATSLYYGEDPSRKNITTYFDKGFSVPSTVRKLYLRVMYDDGFVFYLNGREGGRAHMPSGPVTSTTLALGHEAQDRYVTFDISAQIPNLVIGGGTNSLKVEVHQQAASSSDLVFDAELIAWVDGPLDVETTDSIPSGSYWHFWDRAGAPGAWKTLAYDDRGWSAARGPLGYGETYLEAETSPGTITTYVRKQFTMDPEGTGLIAHVMYDDGFVAYLNGTEIARVAMPSGTIIPSSLSTGHEAGNTYQRFDWTHARPLLALNAGTNVLAIEIHQSSASSSDLVFDLALEIVGGWSNLAETGEAFHDVHFFDPQRGLAVGWNGRIWRTRNAGVQWTELRSGTTEDLHDVVFADATHGWITGDDGVLLRTVDGGASWTVMPPDFRAVTRISPISATEAFMVGTEEQFDNGAYAIYRTTDGGVTWTRLGYFAPFDDFQIYMADALNGWVTIRREEDNSLSIARTTDGAASWTVQWTGGGVDERFDGDFEVIDAQTAWMVGGWSGSTDVGEFKLVTRDGGTTWEYVEPSVYDMALSDVEFVDARHGWAIGADGTIIATEDGGLQWVGQQGPGVVEGADYAAIRFFDRFHGWAIGFDRVDHTSRGGW